MSRRLRQPAALRRAPVQGAGRDRPRSRGRCASTRTPRAGLRRYERPPLPLLLALVGLLLAALLTCAGCGGSTLGPAPPSALVPGCPGGWEAGHPGACPYTRVTLLGRRGEGVLRCPEALAFAPDGSLYVADQFSHLVQRFSAAGRFLGQWGVYGAGPGQLGAVDGLAVSAAGEVYVLDATHDRVERFSPAGRLLGEWGRRGHALGELDFGPGFGPDKPPGGALAVGGGHVYVSDSGNDRVVRYDLDGSHPLLWGPPGTAPGRFSSPRGLAVSGGVVYVADEGNHRVQALDARGRPLYAEGVFGKGPGQFVNPFGVAVHGGRVYVVDDNNNRVAVLTRTLVPLGAWSGAGSLHLSYIRAAAVAPSGRVYVADTAHGRVVAFTPSGHGLFAFGVSGAAPGQLVAPLGVAAGAGGAVVVETYGSRSPVYVYDRALRLRAVWQRGGGAILGTHWFGPTAAALAPDGSAWVTDPRNGVVRHLSSAGGFLGALGDPSPPTAGGGEAAGAPVEPLGVALAPGGGPVYVADAAAGRVERFGDSGRLEATIGSGALTRPVGVALAPDGAVYVADAGAARVVAFAPGGAVLAAWGGPGSRRGRFQEPAGVAVDAAGHVFVVDRRAARVQEFTARGRPLAAWGLSGGGLGELALPSGVAVDCRGDVLVADTANNRVQVFAGVGQARPRTCR